MGSKRSESMRIPAALGFLLSIACVSLAMAQAQQKAATPKATPPARVYYDSYEPSQRQKLRRESCNDNEVMNEAFCVKKCLAGYAMQPGRPLRCRSVNPL